MLLALDVRDFVILEKTSLEFGAGFAVLTGETGAGKSMLVDAIELLVGGRGDASMLRQGAERADLSAEFGFAPSHPIAAWLESNDLQGDSDKVILRRTIDRGAYKILIPAEPNRIPVTAVRTSCGYVEDAPRY
jgi:DNA repair protein RecN (Recombination protein N)